MTDRRNTEPIARPLVGRLKSKQCKTQQNKSTVVQSPLTTLGQEMMWAYCMYNTADPTRGGSLIPYSSLIPCSSLAEVSVEIQLLCAEQF